MADRLESIVPALLRNSRHVDAVVLAGSRARGTDGPYSDWDFAVTTTDFGALAVELPELFAPIEPLFLQWDRLSPHACYMLLLDGPVKVDLLFDDVPHELEPPWVADATTLVGIDGHFWDWILWLTSKVDAGKVELVADELVKMHGHLLEPLGVTRPPTTLADAIALYRAGREPLLRHAEFVLDPRLERQVSRVVDRLSR